MNDLISVEKLNAVTLFNQGGSDPLLEAIKKRVAEMPQDISTPEGREAIRSGAYEIARTKTAIDKMRKDLVAEQKAALKKVDAEGSRIWDELEALQHSYRQPLTEWENRDKVRVAAHEAALAEIERLLLFPEEPTIPDIEKRIAKSIEISGSRSWEEFTHRATLAHNTTHDALTKKLEARKKHEAEQAELERLRREETERKQREHEERIAKEAAEKAKIEVEEKARKLAEAEAARVKAEAEKAEQERLRIQQEKDEAEARAKKAAEALQQAKEQAERDRVIAEEKAAQEARDAETKLEMERLAAEGRAKLAKIQADRDAEAAAQRERDKIAAEKKAEEEAKARREADKAHKKKINNEILIALESLGVAEATGKNIIQAIALNNIPHIKIQY